MVPASTLNGLRRDGVSGWLVAEGVPGEVILRAVAIDRSSVREGMDLRTVGGQVTADRGGAVDDVDGS
jgi:hypothetical protein